MERWEYKTVRAKEISPNVFSSKKTAVSMDQVFNEYGRQGWEVVSFNWDSLGGTGVAALMKRRR